MKQKKNIPPAEKAYRFIRIYIENVLFTFPLVPTGSLVVDRFQCGSSWIPTPAESCQTL